MSRKGSRKLAHFKKIDINSVNTNSRLYKMGVMYAIDQWTWASNVLSFHN